MSAHNISAKPVFSDIGGKTLRPVWAFLLGGIREYFLAFAPGAPEADAKKCYRISPRRKAQDTLSVARGVIIPSCSH